MNPLIHVAGWTLVHFVWQGALIALAATAALRLLRSASAHARYATACVALAAMLASPVITARLLLGASPETPTTSVAQFQVSHEDTAGAPAHLSMVAGAHPGDLPPLGFFQCSWAPPPGSCRCARLRSRRLKAVGSRR